MQQQASRSVRQAQGSGYVRRGDPLCLGEKRENLPGSRIEAAQGLGLQCWLPFAGVAQRLFLDRREHDRQRAEEVLQPRCQIRLGTAFSVQEMAVRSEWVGKSLRELELRRHFGITVIALHDILNDQITATPDPDVVLKGSETLLVAGKDEDLAKVADEK